MHAKLVPELVRLLLVIDVLLSQHANVTKNTTLLLISAETAQLVNSEISIPIDANLNHRYAIKMEEFNWANNNAINAKNAQLDNNL